MRNLTNRRGMALPLAIFALVIVGALVAGSFFIGWQEQRVGRNTVKLQQAFGAAEAGAQATVANWDIDVYNALPLGGTLPRPRRHDAHTRPLQPRSRPTRADPRHARSPVSHPA